MFKEIWLLGMATLIKLTNGVLELTHIWETIKNGNSFKDVEEELNHVIYALIITFLEQFM